MRKYLFDFMIIAVFLSFTACDDKKDKIVGLWKKDGEQIIYKFDKDGTLTEYRLKGEIHVGQYLFTQEKTLLLHSPGFSAKNYITGVSVNFVEDNMHIESLQDFTSNATYKRLNAKEYESTLQEIAQKNCLRLCNKLLSDLQKRLYEYRIANGTYPLKSGPEGWAEFAPGITKDELKKICSQLWFFSEGWQYKIALQNNTGNSLYIWTESINLYTNKTGINPPAWLAQKKEPMTLLP